MTSRITAAVLRAVLSKVAGAVVAARELVRTLRPVLGAEATTSRTIAVLTSAPLPRAEEPGACDGDGASAENGIPRACVGLTKMKFRG
jgi:hypothetical protein